MVLSSSTWGRYEGLQLADIRCEIICADNQVQTAYTKLYTSLIEHRYFVVLVCFYDPALSKFYLFHVKSLLYEEI